MQRSRRWLRRGETSLSFETPIGSRHGRIACSSIPAGQVGALNEVYPGPDKTTKLDLDPAAEGDNFGTSWAATRGKSALEKGACP